MSIQSEINRIISARDSSFNEIEAKGVTVPSGATIDSLPSLIAQIQGGGTLVIQTQDSAGGTIVEIISEIIFTDATGVIF